MLHLDESVSAAPGVSPGVVVDDEILIRELYNPNDISEKEVKNSAIPRQDLICRGLSCHRLEYVSKSIVTELTERRLANKDGWQFVGLARLRVRSIRSLQCNGRRAFVVIDTALEQNRSHASVFAADGLSTSKSQAKELRRILMPLFRDIVSLNDAFPL